MAVGVASPVTSPRGAAAGPPLRPTLPFQGAPARTTLTSALGSCTARMGAVPPGAPSVKTTRPR